MDFLAMTHKKRVFIIAGEPSGDLLGAHLLRSLKKRPEYESIEFKGVGGELMEKEGLSSLFSIHELAIMGIFEGISKLYGIYKRFKFLEKVISEFKPHMIITIDFPGFNFKLSKRFKGTANLVHYVAPTVWAWREGRAEKVAKFLDHLLALFPFEPPYFEKENLETTFVGHPLLDELPANVQAGKDFRKNHGIGDNELLVCVLPGSRRSELKYLWPIFKESLNLLKNKVGDFRVVLPTFSHFKEMYAKENWLIPPVITTTSEEKYAAFAASNVALAASGTVALELARASLPMIIAYKGSKLTEMIVRSRLKIDRFCMVNILLDMDVVPELMQENCTPELISNKVSELVLNPEAYALQKGGLKDAISKLKHHNENPSDRAANVILSLLNKDGLRGNSSS